MKDEKIYTLQAGNFPLLLEKSIYRPQKLFVKGTLPAGSTLAGKSSEGSMPEGFAPETNAPAGKAPEGCAPEGFAPEIKVPAGNTPAGSTLADNVSAGSMPETNAPAGNVSAGLMPEGCAPEIKVPAGNVSAGNAAPIGIAMVGTRRPSSSAAELCRRLVFSLRGTSAVVVSGLAQGIDSLCHEAALEAGIPTIAVLAQGLGTKIEGSRGVLARRILESGGALVSEFEPDVPGYKSHFPARNRIIAGLCRATVVVQSREKGGALLTADFARKDTREVFAIPGDFDSDVAKGTNNLLDAGYAKPVFKPENLSSVLGLPKRGGMSIASLTAAGCALDKDTCQFFARVNGYKKTFTELQAESGLNVNQLLTILTELEIAGLAHTEDNFLFQFNGVT